MQGEPPKMALRMATLPRTWREKVDGLIDSGQFTLSAIFRRCSLAEAGIPIRSFYHYARKRRAKLQLPAGRRGRPKGLTKRGEEKLAVAFADAAELLSGEWLADVVLRRATQLVVARRKRRG